MVVAFTLPTIRLTALDSDSAPSIERVVTNPAGTASGNQSQDSSALTVTFITDLRGRSYRGRNYLPGMPNEATVNGSSWSVVKAAAMADCYDALRTLLIAEAFSHVVASRYHNGVRRTVGVATGVTQYRGNTKIAVQRRRIAGTGA
jgi:hypothetical protein